MTMSTKTYAIDPGTKVLMSCPCWENHPRGKNWMAAITLDPRAPSGLERRFFTKARGEGFYIIDLSQNACPFAVEFGADYYTSSGKKRTERVYGVVREIRPDELVLEVHVTAAQAVKTAQESPADIDAKRFSEFSTSELFAELYRRGAVEPRECFEMVRYVSSLGVPA